MKTIVYIDGFNLYYGCLKHSKDKWLDLFALCSHILNEQNPSTDLIAIKFFTADIKSTFATNPKLAQQSQNNYHRALKQIYGDKVDIIKGYFSFEKSVLPKYQKPVNINDKVNVWKLEEKKTDVNLVLSAYRDASMNNAEQLVFITNDTDIAPVIQYIKNDYPNKVLGVVIPIRKKSKIPPNKSLVENANWTRKYITDIELEKFQLNTVISTKKKSIEKPNYW
jgi:uncharacterized LabA/DUF88 family protein